MAVYLVPNSESREEPDIVGRGEVGFREAVSALARDKSIETRMEKVRAACQREFSDSTNGYGGEYPGYTSQNAYIERTFEDSVIFQKGGNLFRVDYEIDGEGDVLFGDPEEVEHAYVPKKNGAKFSTKGKVSA